MKIEAYQISEVINLKKLRSEYANQALLFNNSELFYKRENGTYCYILSYGVIVFADFNDLEKSEFLKISKVMEKENKVECDELVEDFKRCMKNASKIKTSVV